jgi:hypothetical protein
MSSGTNKAAVWTAISAAANGKPTFVPARPGLCAEEAVRIAEEVMAERGVDTVIVSIRGEGACLSRLGS